MTFYAFTTTVYAYCVGCDRWAPVNQSGRCHPCEIEEASVWGEAE